MSYKTLEVWKIARELSVDIHKMSLALPMFEQSEQGQEIRQSSKRVRTVIVEGYGKRYYKNEFIKCLVYALAANDQTIDHLEALWETKSLQDELLFIELQRRLEQLRRMLDNFIQVVQSSHESPRSEVRERFVEYAIAGE